MENEELKIIYKSRDPIKRDYRVNELLTKSNDFRGAETAQTRGRKSLQRALLLNNRRKKG